MSRHRIAKEPNEIVVGWDPPLQTYFLQVLYPVKDEDEEIILWLGAKPGVIPTVADLEDALASFATLTSHAALTPELRRQLEDEKAKSTRPTALQQRMIEMFAPRELG